MYLTLRDRFSVSLCYKFAMMQFEFIICTEGSNIILLSLYCSCLCFEVCAAEGEKHATYNGT